MSFPEIIRAKRDGEELPAADIEALIAGLTNGSLSDGQAAAFAMATFLRGMSEAECAALTRAMAGSGRRLDWRSIDRPILDKHSTGGVGDKVSLMLAPLMAACGAAVPMISGRGLAHTGGTLDKLEAIPGYEVTPDAERFARVVREVGCAIVGASDDIAPADRRLYAIRDVTATVDSQPLIVASILSKKLAAGLDGLVMDVKTGSGAFMRDLDAARDLASALQRVAGAAGLRTSAVITDMNQVLGRCAGNALELREAIDWLTGAAREPRLTALVLELATEMLRLGGLSADPRAVLASGRPAELFSRMVAGLGGPADLIERPGTHLTAAPVVRPIPATAGFVTAIDVRAVGLAIVGLGGGRTSPGDRIDPAVGLADVASLGEAVGPDRPLALIHARDEASAERADAALRAAFTVGQTTSTPAGIVIERLPA